MTLPAKIELAYKTLISNLEISGLSTFTGIDDATKATPLATVMVQNMTEEAPQLGVWHVTTVIDIICAAADMAKDDADTIADSVFAAVLDADVAATLASLVPDLTVIDVFVKSQDQSTDGDMWVKSLTLDVVAINS